MGELEFIFTMSTIMSLSKIEEMSISLQSYLHMSALSGLLQDFAGERVVSLG
jgi:hypothetical protein